jgi:hypothetical protein
MYLFRDTHVFNPEVDSYRYTIQASYLHLNWQCLCSLPFSGLNVEESTQSLVSDDALKSLKASMDLLKILKNSSGVKSLGSGLLDDSFTFYTHTHTKAKQNKNQDYVFQTIYRLTEVKIMDYKYIFQRFTI